ncbi:hypothetical protein NLU13_5215 [Sarocladium strictum]|uniref:Uncharacterized protein n=1 Tax=Sarocladium strictum TaxID=5046 RepID=A0AA39GGF9_SARSR|nr:hypothetical protein NLU13_5215 [Sarocladium strictum]
MQLKFLLTVAAAATASAGLVGRQAPTDGLTSRQATIDDLESRQATIGKLSNALKDIADSITDGIETIKDISPTTVATVIPKLVGNFNDIVKTIGSFGKELSKVKPADVPKAAESDLCDTYSDFFEVYNNLVDVVIGEKGLLARIPVSVITLPIAGILQVANSAINNFVYSFLQIVPRCRVRAQEELEEASDKFTSAIQKFSDNLYRPVGGDFDGLDRHASN